MARIFPFRAYRYDASRFDLARVLTQPYDKITPAMQERYYALDPHNLVRIEKGREEPGDSENSNVYTRAAGSLDSWVREGALLQDALPSFYACSQDFIVPGTDQRRLRKGFIALLGLEDYSAGVVFRHEQTHTAARVDRLELIRHTRAHTGQLLMLYDDADALVSSMLDSVMQAAPENEVKDEYGVVHRLWPIRDTVLVETIVAAMADRKLLIGDGHHRYEISLAFRDESRARAAAFSPDAPQEKTLVALFALNDPGVAVLPTHRTVGGLTGFDFSAFRKSLTGIFDWYSYPFVENSERAAALAQLCHDLAARTKGSSPRRAIGVYAGGGAFYLFVLRTNADLDSLLGHVPAAQRALDVVLLHRLLFERKLGMTAEAVEHEKNIRYHRDGTEALSAVDSGAAQIAFLLNPVPVRQVYDLALTGNVLPQKSTDFYPKLLSGLAIYRLDG